MFNSPSLNHLKKGGFESSSISVGSLNQEILDIACFCQNFNLSSLASSYQDDGAFAFLTRCSDGGNFLSSLSRFSIFSFINSSLRNIIYIHKVKNLLKKS